MTFVGGIDQFPTLPFLTLRSTGGHGPAPLCLLIYASEQHATEDLKKKGREKSMHAHHAGLCTARSRQKYSIRRAGRALAPAANEGSGNV